MSMTPNGLVAILFLVFDYFQQYRLLKTLQIAPHSSGTRDVIDGKGVSLKSGKTDPLFSMIYPDSEQAGFASKPTMWMKGKDLLAKGHSSENFYVFEKI
jgi:hypothetical protein